MSHIRSRTEAAIWGRERQSKSRSSQNREGSSNVHQDTQRVWAGTISEYGDPGARATPFHNTGHTPETNVSLEKEGNSPEENIHRTDLLGQEEKKMLTLDESRGMQGWFNSTALGATRDIGGPTERSFAYILRTETEFHGIQHPSLVFPKQLSENNK